MLSAISLIVFVPFSLAIPTQPPCRYPVDCLGMPCVYKPFCEGYPEAVCVPDSCGCSPKYYIGEEDVTAKCGRTGMLFLEDQPVQQTTTVHSSMHSSFTVKYQCPATHGVHMGVCMFDCQNDTDCDASKNEKCCFNGGCGKTCKTGVIPPKSGSCPSHNPINRRGPCLMTCAEHAHCESNKLCCSNGCGMECKPPVW